MHIQRSRFICSLSAFFLVSTLCPAATERAQDLSPEKAFRQLRKDLLGASAFPPAAKGYRKEHLKFLRESTTFIRRLSKENQEDLPFLVATHASRGILLLHCGRMTKAREDFDLALKLHNAGSEDGKESGEGEDQVMQLPLGTPDIASIQLYRAVTFAGEGAERFVAEVGDLPESDITTDQEVLQDKLSSFAEALAAKKKYDEAIAVYGIIEKYSLWDEDADQDPKRLIEILEVQKKNQF